MNRAWYLGPALAAAILSIWTASRSPTANPSAAERRPPAQSAAGGAVIAELDRLHTRIEIVASYYAGRDSWLDVGVSPLPEPRGAGR